MNKVKHVLKLSFAIGLITGITVFLSAVPFLLLEDITLIGIFVTSYIIAWIAFTITLMITGIIELANI